MAHSLFGFDLNVRLEDDDDGNIPLDVNEHEDDDGNAGFDLNESVHDEHGNGFDLNLPLDEFGAVDFDYVQNLAGKHAYCTMNKLVFSLYLESCHEFFVL